jgi:hypothetical protein
VVFADAPTHNDLTPCSGRQSEPRQAIEVATCPEALARCLGTIAPTFEFIGLEAGPMLEWLIHGMAEQGLTAVLMETRQVRAGGGTYRLDRVPTPQLVEGDRREKRATDPHAGRQYGRGAAGHR